MTRYSPSTGQRESSSTSPGHRIQHGDGRPAGQVTTGLPGVDNQRSPEFPDPHLVSMTVDHDIECLASDERLQKFTVITVEEGYCHAAHGDGGKSTSQAEVVMLGKPRCQEVMVAVVVPENTDQGDLRFASRG